MILRQRRRRIALLKCRPVNDEEERELVKVKKDEKRNKTQTVKDETTSQIP